jgi:hypothetical protein
MTRTGRQIEVGRGDLWLCICTCKGSIPPFGVGIDDVINYLRSMCESYAEAVPCSKVKIGESCPFAALVPS